MTNTDYFMYCLILCLWFYAFINMDLDEIVERLKHGEKIAFLNKQKGNGNG